MEESQRKILRLVSKKNQAMAGTNRSDVQIGQVSDIVKQFIIWRSGRDTTTTPATWSKPNHGQQGAHISRAGTWQCLRDLNKQSVNRAGPAPMARRLTFSVLFNPNAVQVNLSSLPTRPWDHDKASLRNDPGLVLIRRNSPGCLTFQEDWNGVSRSLWLTATDGTSDCTLHSYCSTTIQSNDSSVQS